MQILNERLECKTIESMLENELVRNYSLSKVESKVLTKEVVGILDSFEGSHLKPVQMVFNAVSAKEGPSKSIKECELVKIVITLFSTEDMKEKSIPSLRRKRTLRITKEAFSQGALLSQMDLEALLSAREAHIQKFLKEINESEELMPTRGTVHDLGRTLTHKKQIINLRKAGYLSPEIARKTKHDIKSVDRYLKTYEKVKTLHEKTSFSNEEISVLTGISYSLVEEYVEIAKKELTGHMSLSRESANP